MATNFTEIYELTNEIKNDTRLSGKATNLIARQMNNLLLLSISEFVAECIPDISPDNRISFEEKEYNLTGSAGDATFTLATPPTNSTGVYVRISDTSTTYTFSYDENTELLTITPALAVDSTIYASVYREGQFNETLNDVEKAILAEGMIIYFTERFRNTDELLDQSVYNRDARIHSQGNHIMSLNAAIHQQYRKRVLPKIRDYTWRFNRDRTRGLSGTPNTIPTFTPNSGS